MGLDDPYTAWCFDEVVYSLGTHVDNEMNAAEQATKKDNMKAGARLRVLQTFLNGGGEEDPDYTSPKAQTGKFRDPASMFTK